MDGELLIEIGTEEIPSAYLRDGLKEFRTNMEECLKEYRIPIEGDLNTYGTPRRIILMGRGVSEKQGDRVQEVTGPPKGAAYDDKGNPTKAAIGFAQKQGISVDELECIETTKGEYLHVKRTIPGKFTSDLLAASLPRLLGEIPWPKSMRWGNVGTSFVRPIHWLLAIFNGKVIPFEFAGVKSGNKTTGHRFMSSGPMEVSGIQDYVKKMQNSSVIIDPEERDATVERVCNKAAASIQAKPMKDPDLIKTVADLVELPSAVCGRFDESFLELPEAVLTTVMREHQKYFAVYDRQNNLVPYFIAINNTVSRDESTVRKGHERVLRARLSDANFFFTEDRKNKLADRINDLKEVIYQTDLGTSYDKVKRFTKLADYLGKKVIPDELDNLKTAAGLCKCDLVTHMVTEFPGLQGVMGREYARIEGYAKETYTAIYEHYLPTRAEGDLPKSKIGALIGVADRMDTIVGCFSVGLEPSGSADPFALRRHAIAIIRIINKMGWDLSFEKFINRAISILKKDIELKEELVFGKVKDFFRERYRQIMIRSGFEPEIIDAVISTKFDRINESGLRMEHLKKFRSTSNDFEALALTFKRVANILKKQDSSHAVDTSLFVEACEETLWKTYKRLEKEIYRSVQKRDFLKALELLAQFRKPVDEFFEGVEILTKENEGLRKNRINLLQNISNLFLSVVDLSKFSI